MPRYEYHCPNCCRRQELQRRIDQRDDIVHCENCWSAMRRVPATSAFTVQGFSAANGYAKKGRD